MKLKPIFARAACVLALAGCAAPAPAPGAKPIRLVASTPLVADLLKNLTQGVDGVEVIPVVPLGSDPHSFEPTPADARKLETASAVFAIGAGYEDEWLNKMLTAQTKPMQLSAGVELQKMGDTDEDDPHIWMDPLRWKQAARAAAQGIIAIAPAISQSVTANTAAYAAKLDALDAEIKTQTAALPAEQKNLVTTHDALGYFAKRYGFRIIGAVMPGVGASGAPSAKEMQTLIELIKTSHAKAIFTEVGLNPALAQTVARESGARVIENLYVDTLSDAGGAAPAYLDMMRHNTRLIAKAEN